MEGAASVITVVSLALSSTKRLYEIVAGIKHAPKSVSQIASYLQDLSSILQQLVGYSANLHLAADLPALIERCAETLKTFQAKVGKLSASDGNRAELMRKNVKALLQERELERMATCLRQHVAGLSLQLSVLEGFVEILLHDLEDMFMVSSKAILSQTERLERLEVSSNQHVTLSTATSSTVSTTKAGVDQIHEAVEGLRATSQASNHSTRKALDEMSERMQGLAGLTTGQSSTLNSILELLKKQVVDRSPQKVAESNPHRPTSPSADSGTETAAPQNSDADALEDAIDRLCEFVNEKDKVLFSAEADSLICDIEKMMIFLSENIDCGKAVQNHGKRKGVPDEKYCNDDQDLQYRREVKRMKGLLTSSGCVAINGKVSTLRHPQSRNLTTTRSHREVPCRSGNFVVRSRLRASPLPHTAPSAYVQELGDFEASITLMPNATSKPNARRRTQIAVFLQQRMLYEGTFLYKPLLTVSALLPSNSEVFKPVFEGDVPGLIKLLSLGDACLNDRDLMGRSLLHYAIWRKRPGMCKYLIDQGADVNFVEPNLIRGFSHPTKMTHALLSPWGGPSNFELSSEDEIECLKVLLEAGADPTTSCSGFVQTFSTRTSRDGSMDALNLVLNYCLDFMDADCETPPNMLLYRHLEGRRWTSDGVALILRKQRLSELPAQKLEGCLAEAIEGSRYEDHEGLKKVLILLIQAGADVYSFHRLEDLEKCGKFHYFCDGCDNTYGPRCRTHDPPHRGFLIEVVTTCGYDADQVIQNTVWSKTFPSHGDCEFQVRRKSSFTSSDEPESLAAGDFNSPVAQSNASEVSNDLEDDYIPASGNNTLFEQQDWSALEGDAAVWRA